MGNTITAIGVFLITGGLHAFIWFLLPFIENFVLVSDAYMAQKKDEKKRPFVRAASMELTYNVVSAMLLLLAVYLIGGDNWLGWLVLIAYGIIRWWFAYTEVEGGWEVFKLQLGGTLSDFANFASLLSAGILWRQFRGDVESGTISSALSNFTTRTGLASGDFSALWTVLRENVWNDMFAGVFILLFLGATVSIVWRVGIEHFEENGSDCLPMAGLVFFCTTIGIHLLLTGNAWMILGLLLFVVPFLLYTKQFALSKKEWLDNILESHFIAAPVSQIVFILAGTITSLADYHNLINYVLGRATS